MNGSNTHRRALVTGASGFIGSYVVRGMSDAGYDVTALDIRNAPALPDGARMVIADIRHDPFPAEPFDVVIHLAALGGVRASVERPADYQATNVDGTRRLLDWASSGWCGRVVFASSSSVYGVTGGRASVETDPPAPLSPYAATKVAGEELGRGFAAGGRTFTALRFFTVWGEGQRPDLALALFRRKLQAAEPISVFGDGRQRRDLTHATDVVRAVLAAADRPGPGFRIHNIGTGRNHSVLEMVGALENKLGLTAELRFVPGHPADVPETLADPRRAADELGWTALVRFPDGL